MQVTSHSLVASDLVGRHSVKVGDRGSRLLRSRMQGEVLCQYHVRPPAPCDLSLLQNSTCAIFANPIQPSRISPSHRQVNQTLAKLGTIQDKLGAGSVGSNRVEPVDWFCDHSTPTSASTLMLSQHRVALDLLFLTLSQLDPHKFAANRPSQSPI